MMVGDEFSFPQNRQRTMFISIQLGEASESIEVEHVFVGGSSVEGFQHDPGCSCSMFFEILLNLADATAVSDSSAKI